MSTFDCPLEQIYDPRVLLRPIRRDTVRYQELYDSIAEHGVLSSIAVMRTGEGEYELVAGMHRLDISRRLRRKTIPTTVRDYSPQKALELQLQENIQRIDATRTEIATQLIRIQQIHPKITLLQLSRLSGKSTKWVKCQLALLELDEEIQRSVDRGTMPVMNAYQLTRLPARSVPEFTTHAILMGRDEFKALVTKKIVEMREARSPPASRPNKFEPHPYMRSIKEALNSNFAANEAADRTAYGVEFNVGFREGVLWMMHLDKPTVDKRRMEYEERRKLI